MRIFLIGFMGVGKSTLGRLLAKQMSLPFFDLDQEIVREVGMSIPMIFDTQGQNYFRKLERKLLHQLIEKEAHFVLATGGGLPCHFDNLSVMNEMGVSIYLAASASSLTTRLRRKIASRPMLKNKDGKLLDFVQSLLNERLEHYSTAKLTVELDLAVDPSENVAQVYDHLKTLLDLSEGKIQSS